MVLVVACAAFSSAYMARRWFGRWLNPLSIYSILWGFCLFNYELRLIDYEVITFRAWAYIVVAWIALYLGACTAILVLGLEPTNKTFFLNLDPQLLRKTIWWLCMISSVGLLSQLIAIQRIFGNPLVALLSNAGDIYGARTSNELSGLGYASSFSFAGCSLAGVYTGIRGKLTFTAMLPIFLVILQLIAVMGRTGLGIAAVLFITAYVYTPGKARLLFSRWQRIAGLVLASGLVAAFLLVSSIRHLDVNFAGITPAMDRVTEYVPFFPSIYTNFSATPVAFSVYLSSPSADKNGFIGMYTFAPFFRLLAKLGLSKGVPPYEENYYTPVPMNTCTYLKNIYSDFGPLGIVMFPYILGFAISGLIAVNRRRPALLYLVVLSNIFVLVTFAFAFDFMVLGDWYVSISVGTAAAFVVGQLSSRSPAIDIGYRLQSVRYTGK